MKKGKFLIKNGFEWEFEKSLGKNCSTKNEQ
jgi:hypothetical protein